MYGPDTITRVLDDVNYIFPHRIKIGKLFLKADFFEKMPDGSLKILYSFCWDQQEYDKLDPAREVIIRTGPTIE